MKRVRGSVWQLVGGLCAALAVVVLFAPAASAAPKGVVDFFGNPTASAGTLGGLFSATPGGVAVDDSTGAIYVVDSGNNRLQRFDSDGTFEWAVGFDVIAPGKPGNLPQNEQVSFSIGGAPLGGSFTLSFASVTTAAIPFNASPAQVQSALEGLSTIGSGNVAVTSPTNPGGGADAGGPYTVEFIGALADTNVGFMSGSATGLTPTGSLAFLVPQPAEGAANFEKCVVAADCKSGITHPDPRPGGLLNSPQGVAVNQATGDVYVTNQGAQRVEQFSSTGVWKRAWGRDVVRPGMPGDKPPASAVRTVTVDATAGSFTLSFKGQTTGDLAFNAPAATVQTALQGLSSIGAGNATVTPAGATGGAGGGTPYVITFAGTLANSLQPAITAANGSTPLSGGAGTVTVQSTVAGSSGFEICETAANCKTGAAGGTAGAFTTTLGHPAVVPAGAPNAGNVLVSEPATQRVEEFTANGEWVRAFGFDAASGGPGNTGTGFEVCSAAGFDVCKAGVAGAGVGQFGSAAVTRVAADSAGNIYTVEPTGNFRVQKLTPSGGSLAPSVFNPSVSTVPAVSLSGTSAANAPASIATGASGNVLVAKSCTAVDCPDAILATERRVYELTAAGGLVETHAAGYAVPSLVGLAADASGSRFYASATSPTARVNILGDPIPPTVTLQATTDVTDKTATLNGTVNPNGGDPGLQTTYRFEVSANGTDWIKVPATNVGIGGGTDAVSVTQPATGLQPNKQYQVRLIANKGGALTTSTGDAGDFETDAAAPEVETFFAYYDTSTSELVLKGSVNPNNTETTYRFEYGAEPCSANPCESVPADDVSVGAGGQAVTVVERVAGLDPDTTYHYRIVADNGVETSPGETTVAGTERTITTPNTNACPNEQYRTGPSTGLADCRAYEWVSNGDSWGLGLGGNTPPITGDGGDRAGFNAQAFGNPQSSPSPYSPYMAVRESSGWAVKEMLPRPEYIGDKWSVGPVTAADLEKVLWPENSLGQNQRAEVQWSFAKLDGTHSPAAPFIEPINHTGPNTDGNLAYVVQGASIDLSKFVFVRLQTVAETGFQLVSDEPMLTGSFRSNLYAVTDAGSPDAALSVVNRADGENGAVIGGVCGAGLGAGTERGVNASGAISGDGRVVYFTVRPGAPPSGTCGNVPVEEVAIGGPARLFKRVDGESTVGVSASQCDPACGGPDGDDVFRDASDDGSVVYFTTPRRLLNSDTDSTDDLYVHDASPPGGEPSLSLVSLGEAVVGHPVPGAGANALGVLDDTADGSRVYFAARGVLTGANERGDAPVAGEPNVYVYERDESSPEGEIRFVATLTDSDSDSWKTNRAGSALPEQGTDAGRFLVFLTDAALVGDDADANDDVYRYDDEAGVLVCLSCAANGPFDVKIARRSTGGGPTTAASTEQRGRAASADASTVVFTTPEPVLDADDNDVHDVYVWRDGALSLISGGTGEFGVFDYDRVQTQLDSSSLTGISPDGENVFFYTLAPLSAADGNNAMDLYDARIGGGFPEPEEAGSGCAVLGDQCQGDGPGTVSSDTKTSAGGGNAAAGERRTLAITGLSAKARRRAARRGTLALSVRNVAAGKLSVSAWAKLGKRTRVGGLSKRVTEAGVVKVSVRLSSKARGRLRSGRALRLTVVASQAGARARSISVLLPGVKS
jgi:hypothetical protein